MATSYQGKVAPTASRYVYSSACKFVSVNSDGKRMTFGGANNLTLGQSAGTQSQYELNNDKLHPYEITKGCTDAVSVGLTGVELVSGSALQQITGVNSIQGLQNQNIPFDIEFYQTKQKINADGSIDPSIDSQTTKLDFTVKNCVISKYQRTYKTGTDLTVSYTVDISATHIEE